MNDDAISGAELPSEGQPLPACAEPARPRLLHFHQFKNGGSTLDWILARNFGKAFAEHHGEGSMAALRVADMERMLDAMPDVTAFSSHHFRPPLPQRPGLMGLWLIRHPLDRVPSVYEQERRSAPAADGSQPFPDFLTWFEQTRTERPFMFCDAQVALIGKGGHYDVPPDESALCTAIRELERAPFVGVVDQYDLSMVALEHRLQQWWPEFDAAYRTQNDSAREDDLQERLLALRARLGDEKYMMLAQLNRLDLGLYRYAQWRLKQALAQIADVASRQMQLESRCLALGVD